MNTPERDLLILPGGTRADDVARLRAAVAALLGQEGAGGEVSGGSSAGAAGDLAGARGSAGCGDADGGSADTAQQAPRASRTARPLLVPAGPGEDAEALAAQVAEVMDRVPASADVLLRTSGSTTGRSSLIAVSARALRVSAEATYARLSGPGQWVLALPAHHVAGLQVLVRSVLAGTEPVVVDTTGGFRTGALAAGLGDALARAAAAGARPGAVVPPRPAGCDEQTGAAPSGWCEAGSGDAQDAPLPVYVSLVPTQLLRCLDDPRATAALARTAAVLVGGAATDAGLHERALAAGIPVVRTYGMSETGGGCVYDGLPLDGVEVRVEDPDADGVGRVVLAGPVLAEAVIASVGQGGASRLRVRPDGRRELATSDRGRLEGGVLTVLGRVDDVIVTGGIKVEPRQVEEVLCRLPGVAQACVVGVPDAQWGQAVVAAIVPEPPGADGAAGAFGAHGPDLDAVRRQVRAVLDGAHAPKRIVVMDRLPERGPGKVDRRAVAAALGSGQTDPDRRRDRA